MMRYVKVEIILMKMRERIVSEKKCGIHVTKLIVMLKFVT